MPTKTTIAVPLAYSDPTSACCAGCPEVMPGTVHITNDHGSFALPYSTTNKNWTLTYPISSDLCAASALDPDHLHSGSPVLGRAACRKPVDSATTDMLNVTVTVSCPPAGGAWKVTYATTAEDQFFRLVGAVLADSYDCTLTDIEGVTGFGVAFQTRSVTSPAASAEAAGCATTQTFPSPGATWHDTHGRAYTNVPDPGVTEMSA